MDEVGRFDGTDGPRIVGPRDGSSVDLGAISAPVRGLGRGVGRRILACRASLGNEVVYAEPGDLAFKPRDQWHTFWSAGDTECRILEIISPATFEHYFEGFPSDPARRPAHAAAYGLEVDMDRVQSLCEEHGLRSPPLVM